MRKIGKLCILLWQDEYLSWLLGGHFMPSNVFPNTLV